MQPHFQTPTLPNNTQVACTSSKTCHIVLSLSPGLNEGWYACIAHYQIDKILYSMQIAIHLKNLNIKTSTNFKQFSWCVLSPEIQQTKGNSDFTHVFNLNTKFKAIGNNCTADVAIKPLFNHNSSDLYCFDVSFPR